MPFGCYLLFAWLCEDNLTIIEPPIRRFVNAYPCIDFKQNTSDLVSIEVVQLSSSCLSTLLLSYHRPMVEALDFPLNASYFQKLGNKGKKITTLSSSRQIITCLLNLNFAKLVRRLSKPITKKYNIFIVKMFVKKRHGNN
jgi:hypothetical protein